MSYDVFVSCAMASAKNEQHYANVREQVLGIVSCLEQECGYRPRTEMVTSYEYQTEARYIPPKTEAISQYHSRWKLAESAPVCTPALPEGSIQNRIVGTIYRR